MGNRVTITKTIFVVERFTRKDHIGEAVFRSEFDEDDSERYRSVSIDMNLDEALGQPNTVTITLQPGDTLNG
ncbi:hypothetical protein LCGC14_1719030 [marine sediment metagenome]|uniref:Uncharacterized protein n=1 Tax=marine sediment metagenome TaxID=412755 RepID=A0A0F9HDA3_9ZZZZ